MSNIYDSQALTSALDSDTSGSEPILPILNEYTRYIIENHIYRKEVYDNPITGKKEWYRAECLYPDLEIAIALAMDHLNLIRNARPEIITSWVDDWRHKTYLPKRKLYSDMNDQIAVDILDAINAIFEGNTHCSSEGTHQRFYLGVKQSIREVKIRNAGEE